MKVNIPNPAYENARYELVYLEDGKPAQVPQYPVRGNILNELGTGILDYIPPFIEVEESVLKPS